MPNSKSTTSVSSDRDLNQRSVGCIAFSVVTHSVLLIALAFIPKMTAKADDVLAIKKNKTSDVTVMELQSSTSSNDLETKPIVAEPPLPKVEEPIQPSDIVAAPEPPAPVKKPAKQKPVMKVAKVVKPKETTPALPAKVEKPVEELDPKLSDDNADVELARTAQPVVAADPAAAVASADAATAPSEQPLSSDELELQKMNAASASGTMNGEPAGAGVPVGSQIRDAADLVPRPGNPSPQYPQIDRISSRQGLAVVVGKVNADGSMGDVYVEKSSGSKTLDQEAQSTFKSWKFMPGQEGYVRKPFKFALAGEARELHAHLGH
jgi:TonB family protein